MIQSLTEYGAAFSSQLLAAPSDVQHFFGTRTYHHPQDSAIWMPRQVHGTDVHILDAQPQANQPLPEADAVITNLPGQWIGVRTADCVPILLADTQLGVVAAVHSGWRGTVAHIAAITVQCMVKQMGSTPQQILAAIGPSISPEAFEVGPEVAEAFRVAGRESCVLTHTWGPTGKVPFAKPHIDLWQSCVMDLLDEGLLLEHIDCTPLCTHTRNDLFFSARREGIGTGRNISAIQITR